MIRWLRKVAPPWWVVAIFSLSYLLPLVVLLSIATLLPGDQTAQGLAASYRKALKIFQELEGVGALPISGGLAYGAWRVVGFSPAYRPNYRQWLMTTPWDPGSRTPLPLGPRTLVLQDAVILASLGLLAMARADVHPVQTIAAFTVGYIALLSIELWVTGCVVEAYVGAFWLGGMALTWTDPVLLFMASLLALALSRPAIQRIMGRFPWDELRLSKIRLQPVKSRTEAVIGWPFVNLSFDPPKPAISYTDGVGLSLLSGWMLYVACKLLQRAQDHQAAQDLAMSVAYFATLCGAWIRVVLYTVGQRILPPVGILGRLFTGRWIIPDFDRVLIAPAAMLIVGLGALHVLGKTDVPVEFYCPMTLVAVALIGLIAGPQMARWKIVGRHRVLPLPANVNLYEKASGN